MKTSTIVLASLTATGLLSAFLFPIAIMLFSKSDASPLMLSGKPVTVAAPEFRNLVIERTDTTPLYISLNLTIVASDSTATPSITLNEGWNEWLTLESRGDTLHLNIAPPEGSCQSLRCHGLTTISGTMRIPPLELKSVTAHRLCDNITFEGVKTPSLTLGCGMATLNIDNCLIDTLDMTRKMPRADINLRNTRIASLSCDISNISYASLQCADNASVETLTITSESNNPHDFHLNDAADIGTILINPAAPGGRVDLSGLRSATIR